MIFIMGVTLFTSRIILDKLGVTDYGIYGAVGGVVGMLGFLDGTLSTGTSRFLTFELATDNKERLRRTFSTAFYTHLVLALLVAIILETAGIWFICNKLIIPPNRLSAAFWCLHFSVLTTIVSITQVPYTSVIIAHENMGVYAYVGIYEAVMKLLVAYLLSIATWDRLIFYAVLIACVQISVAFFYRVFSVRCYWESKLKRIFDKRIFCEMLGFSGWSLMANVGEVLIQQGYVVLINMFFLPAIVAAQTIGNQISGAMMQFINNFRTAINPQIIKLYAAKEYTKSRKLTLNSSVYVFDLLLLLGLPAIVLMEPILNLWLVKVPDYAVVFAQYIVARNILSNFSAAFYVPMMASGELKDNSLASIFLTFTGFGILYLLLKIGFSVMWVQYMAIIQCILFSLVVKPLILIKKLNYSVSEISACVLKCAEIALLPCAVSAAIAWCVNLTSIPVMGCAAVVMALSVCVSAWLFMDGEMRQKLTLMIKNKILKR